MGPLVVAASGSVGGVTFARSPAGPIARARQAPIQPRTALQLQRRHDLNYFATAWKSLTDAQRAGWAALASTYPRQDALGRTFFWSGFQLYIALNQTRRLFVQTILNAAPSLDAIPQITTIGLTAQASTILSLSYTAAGASATTGWEFWAHPPLSQGVGSLGKPKFRYLSGAAGNIASPVNLLATYQAKFGSWSAGERLSVMMFPVSANRFLGPPLLISAIST